MGMVVRGWSVNCQPEHSINKTRAVKSKALQRRQCAFPQGQKHKGQMLWSLMDMGGVSCLGRSQKVQEEGTGLGGLVRPGSYGV